MKTKFYVIGFFVVLFLGLILYIVSRGSDKTIDERVVQQKVEVKKQPIQQTNQEFASSFNSTELPFSNALSLINSPLFMLLIAIPAVLIVMKTFWFTR